VLWLAWVLALFYFEGTLRRAKQAWAVFVLPVVIGLVATSRALLAVGGTVASIVDAAARDELGGHYVWVRPSTEDLDALTALIDAGTVAVDVAQVFELADAAAAHEASQTGHVRGKVVVRVD
jgi:NADPH2:quinone reductase